MARTAVGAETRARIVDAALKVLKKKGFGGATARAIAGEAGLNPALIYYHFGDVKGALLAALDHTSELRMQAYRPILDRAASLPELIELSLQIYQEDLAGGHITVLSELIAASLKHPELGQEVVARMEPWVDFAEEAIKKAMSDSPFATVAPARPLAFGLVGLFLGIDLLAHLDPGRPEIQELLSTARAASQLVGPLLGAKSQ